MLMMNSFLGEVSVLMGECTFIHVMLCILSKIWVAFFLSFLPVLIISWFVHKESDLFIDV